MNKPIKAKNLPLFSIIDLDQLRRENHLEGTEVTDFFTARDGKIYLLMEQPSEAQGKDWPSTPSTYTAVEIQQHSFHLYRSGNPAGLGGTAGAGNDAVSSWPLEVPVPLFAARR